MKDCVHLCRNQWPPGPEGCNLERLDLEYRVNQHANEYTEGWIKMFIKKCKQIRTIASQYQVNN